MPTDAERLDFYKSAPPEMNFCIERGHLEVGRSFSAEALEVLTESVTLYIGAQLLAAWERRGEPPSVATVHIQVEVA